MYIGRTPSKAPTGERTTKQILPVSTSSYTFNGQTKKGSEIDYMNRFARYQFMEWDLDGLDSADKNMSIAAEILREIEHEIESTH